MIKKEILNKIETEARKYFEGASSCHDFSHIERVRKIALKLAKKEGGDKFIIEAAALLHDIGRKKEMDCRGEICHAEFGSRKAGEILKDLGVEKEQIDNIVHCVLTHRSRNDLKPETIEAKIIFDADKLDSIGAVGIGRNFLFAGFCGSGNLYTGNEKKIVKEGRAAELAYTKEDSAVLEYEFKLKHIKDKMLTETGKKMAIGRSEFMKDFFEHFWKEIGGEI